MKKYLTMILAIMMAVCLLIPAATAESITDGLEDSIEEMNSEFRSARQVTPYSIDIRPTRVTGWVNVYWAPSKSAEILGIYQANAKLTVLQELRNWFQVQDPQTGMIGYIENSPYIVKIPEKVAIGTLSINGVFTLKCGIPDGYEVKTVTETPEQVIALITSPDPERAVMTLTVAYDETYAHVDRMNDLDEKDFDELEKTFTDVDPTVEISYGDTGLGTRLLIAKQTNGEQDYVDFLSIYKGYFVEFVMTAPQGLGDKNLTDEQIKLCIDFLTDLDFVPADQPAEVSAEDLAGQTVMADLTNYDGNTRTVQAELKRVVLLDPETVENLEPGDTLVLGEDSEVIETLEKDEDGYILINNEISFWSDGEKVHAYLYEKEYTETFAVLTLKVPENLVFSDWIDPETGEQLDTPTEHTAEEWIDMMTAGGYPDFASENVKITFDENGELAAIQRYYTPWQ